MVVQLLPGETTAQALAPCTGACASLLTDLHLISLAVPAVNKILAANPIVLPMPPALESYNVTFHHAGFLQIDLTPNRSHVPSPPGPPAPPAARPSGPYDCHTKKTIEGLGAEHDWKTQAGKSLAQCESKCDSVPGCLVALFRANDKQCTTVTGTFTHAAFLTALSDDPAHEVCMRNKGSGPSAQHDDVFVDAVAPRLPRDRGLAMSGLTLQCPTLPAPAYRDPCK